MDELKLWFTADEMKTEQIGGRYNEPTRESITRARIILDWFVLYNHVDTLTAQRDGLLELCKAALDAMTHDLLIFDRDRSSFEYVEVMDKLRIEIAKAGEL